jgi:hypothetical protein
VVEESGDKAYKGEVKMNLLQLADSSYVPNTSYLEYVEQVCAAHPTTEMELGCAPIRVNLKWYEVLGTKTGSLAAAALTVVMLNSMNDHGKPHFGGYGIDSILLHSHMGTPFDEIHCNFQSFFGYSALAMFTILVEPTPQQVESMYEDIKDVLDEELKQYEVPGKKAYITKIANNFREVMEKPRTILTKSVNWTGYRALMEIHRQWVKNLWE